MGKVEGAIATTLTIWVALGIGIPVWRIANMGAAPTAEDVMLMTMRPALESDFNTLVHVFPEKAAALGLATDYGALTRNQRLSLMRTYLLPLGPAFPAPKEPNDQPSESSGGVHKALE